MTSREIRIREVLPRDGFQDFGAHIPAQTKIAIIEALWGNGLRWIEVSSMVHPRWVPQFADAEEVLAAIADLDGLLSSVFVPNLRGLRRAFDSAADEVSLAVASTDSLCKKNFAMTRDRMFDEIVAMANQAVAAGTKVSVTIGGAFGCPFEGAVAGEVVVDLAEALCALPIDNLFVADTIGVATADDVGRLVKELVARLGQGVPLGVHLHGGAGAVDGVMAGVEAGACLVDTALTGLGGCPFVPSAPGNVSTELTVAALETGGFTVPVSSAALSDAAQRVTRLLEATEREHAGTTK